MKQLYASHLKIGFLSPLIQPSPAGEGVDAEF
ncbi:hypothetical protein NMYAN_340010 [Nitrosomonas nitrosa]|uniref:Uncharacterized protein n=1 Tax=Nitrosomonas nitrosa TaxID=52442 RepID=A0A8H9DB02_9PROT|nr:hypothetical protein NMYAN_340010 [Nitrosomonas nitrosa]